MIYLDYAAATPLDERVRAAMEPYFSERFFNPSALYWPAQQVAKDVAMAREQVAAWLGARPPEVIFTAGGTEANNLAIQGIMQAYPEAEIVVSSIEHDAVLEPARQYTITEVPVPANGIVQAADVQAAITDKTVLLSIMYANNEIGTVQPIREVSQLVAKIRQQRRQTGNTLPLYFHSDACQAANYLDLHVARLGVDLMTLNGGKIYGPKQSGCLYVRAGLPLIPQVRGGGQEHKLRSGTENVAAIAGFSTALTIAQQEKASEVVRLQKLQGQFMSQLAERLPQAQINGSHKKRLPNNVHVTFPGCDNERLLIQLDEAGVLAAAGSACSASNDEPSHVLRAIGLSDSDARASLRFTMGRATTEATIAETVSLLARFLA